MRVRDDFDIFRDVAEVCNKGGLIVRLDKGTAVGKKVNRVSVITEVARRGDLDCGQHARSLNTDQFITVFKLSLNSDVFEVIFDVEFFYIGNLRKI